jgi:hypothetical protein
VFDGYADVAVTPKFRFEATTPVYTIGSCFARNIEKVLSKAGVPIPDKLRGKKEWVQPDRVSDAGLFNRFNVPSIYYEAQAVSDPLWLGDLLIYDQTPTRAYDAFFSPAQALHSREDKLAIRKEILDYQHSFLRDCGAVFITLGLSEAIFDRQDGLYINGAPGPLGRWALKNSERFSGEVIGVDDTINYLNRARDAIRSVAGTSVKFVVTVSPVPLDATFTTKDVIVANESSKARLRIAADEFASAYEDVDYFPSYEIVTKSNPTVAFNDDRRHVRGPMVNHIMQCFMRNYFGMNA